MNLKNRLIRLGSQNPELQKHIRPVLDKVAIPERPKLEDWPDVHPKEYGISGSVLYKKQAHIYLTQRVCSYLRRNIPGGWDFECDPKKDRGNSNYGEFTLTKQTEMGLPLSFKGYPHEGKNTFFDFSLDDFNSPATGIQDVKDILDQLDDSDSIKHGVASRYGNVAYQWNPGKNPKPQDYLDMSKNVSRDIVRLIKEYDKLSRKQN